MAVSLDQVELNLAQSLQLTGMPRSSAVLAVVMVTRAHARPEDELVEIVRQYPGLESIWEAREAIRDLIRRGWLAKSLSYGVELTHQASDLRERIAQEVSDPSIAEQLLAMRANLEPYVKVIGAMKDQLVYASFLDLLRGAQKEICLPMLATTPYDETVRILRERASAGVRVRILLGAPNLVAKWRGETMRRLSIERVKRWVELFKDCPTVEIRLSHLTEDMAIATCLSVDGVTVRLDIYDPYNQRSLEGVMIEIVSPQGMRLNVVRIFQGIFDEAWARGLVAGRLARIRWILQRWWKVWLGLAALAAAFVPVPVSSWRDIWIGLAVGILAPTLLEEAPRARQTIRIQQHA